MPKRNLTIHDALGDPRSKYSSGYKWQQIGQDYSGLEWNEENSIPKPTEEELNEELARIQALEDYQAPRQMAYPSIQDQLDYIYHNSITKWKSDMIKPVKDAHPKP